MRVAYLTLESETGLRIMLQATRATAVHDLARLLRLYAGGAVSETAARSSVSSLPEPARAALAALGLTELPTAPVLRSRYLDLIKRNHPDRFAVMDRDLRDLAEARTKEINAAYDALRPLAPHERSADVPEPSVSVAPSSETRSRNDEGFALGVAACAAMLVFVCFRFVAQGTTSSLAAGGTPSSAGQGALVETEHGHASPVPTTSAGPGLGQAERIPRACTVRASASAKAQVVGSVRAGAVISVLRREGGWTFGTDVHGRTGWTGPACWKKVAGERTSP